MHYLELPPPIALAGVVRCFWFLRSDMVTGVPQPVVADGRLEIVLHAAEPFSQVAEGGATPQDAALLAGQLTQPLHLLQRGRADVVGIRFRTAAATTLIRHPITELTNQVAPLAVINPRLRDRLLVALRHSHSPAERRDALSAVLVREIQGEPDRLASSVVRIMDRPDAGELAAISRQVGVSARTLERRVTTATGLAPRMLRRAMRFRRVFRGLQDAESGGMTAAALAAGYFDQAHCIREFRHFTGQSPSEFFGQDPTLASALVGSVQSPEL